MSLTFLLDLDDYELFTYEEMDNQSMNFLSGTVPGITNFSIHERQNFSGSSGDAMNSKFMSSTPMSLGHNEFDHRNNLGNHFNSSYHSSSDSNLQYHNEFNNNYNYNNTQSFGNSEIGSHSIFPPPSINTKQETNFNNDKKLDYSPEYLQFSFVGEDHTFTHFEPDTPEPYGYLDTTFDFNPNHDILEDMEDDRISPSTHEFIPSGESFFKSTSYNQIFQSNQQNQQNTQSVNNNFDLFQKQSSNQISNRGDFIPNNFGPLATQTNYAFQPQVYIPFQIRNPENLNNSLDQIDDKNSKINSHSSNEINDVQQNINVQKILVKSKGKSQLSDEKRSFDIVCASVGPSERNRKGNNHLFTEDKTHYMPMIKKDKNIRFKVQLHPDSVFCQANSTVFTKDTSFVHELGVLYVQHFSMSFRSGTKNKWENVGSGRWNVNEVAAPSIIQEEDSAYLTFELNFPNSQREMGVKTNKNVYRFEFLLSLKLSENHPIRLSSVYFIYKIDSNGKKEKCVVNQLATTFQKERGYIYHVFNENNDMAIIAFDEFHHIHFSESMDQGIYNVA